MLHRPEITFGFRGVPLQWMRSYLDGRIQFILHEGKSTTLPRPAVCGIPQGSVLGPLLFTLYTADIGTVIQQYGLSHHSYVDDNQLYSSCNQNECAALKSRLITCVESIGEWISSNGLMLNPSKSEFIWCASQRRTHLIDRSAFVLPDGLVYVSSSLRNLGACFDGVCPW